VRSGSCRAGLSHVSLGTMMRLACSIQEIDELNAFMSSGSYSNFPPSFFIQILLSYLPTFLPQSTTPSKYSQHYVLAPSILPRYVARKPCHMHASNALTLCTLHLALCTFHSQPVCLSIFNTSKLLPLPLCHVYRQTRAQPQPQKKEPLR
jgi:hypothetical protein